MKKKNVVLLLSSLLLLAGCGSGGGETDSSSSSVPSFLITFKDEEGNVLDEKRWNEASNPSFTYEKQDTKEWDYTVDGWSSSMNGEVLTTLPSVTQDATYYAIVSKVKQKYTLSFESNGGSEVTSITVDYGSSVNEPSKPTQKGYKFICWCSDEQLSNEVIWPLEIKDNQTVYAKWNETVGLSTYLDTLKNALNQDPFSFIPESMQPKYEANLVSQKDVTYNFASNTSISSIKYGGFGEQWGMVIDNIQQSELFYTITNLADSIISGSVSLFNNYFDQNPSDTNKELDDEGYYAKVNFADNVLNYTIRFKSGFNIPLLGEAIPQIDMLYDITSNRKEVRFNLSNTNAMKYIVTENSYEFALKYGIEALTRSAYCSLTKDSKNNVTGHIYEYITLKGKDAIKSCADFYITDTYTSVVGNKASGIILMDGYINELYKTSEGKLLGYKVKETKTIFGFEGTYNTLWFNLSDISGISSVKVTARTEGNQNTLNPNDIYVNGSSSLFVPTYNKKLSIKTSRKYDIELRHQYRYGIIDGKLSKFDTEIPMMFIQDDNDKDTNFSDFSKDIKKENNITASVSLSATYLAKIRDDYSNLIPVFEQNKELMDSQKIISWIGNVA